MNYKGMSDEQLVFFANNNDPDAAEHIVLKYNRLVRICSRPYFLVGGDNEDLIQEGMMGLLSAIRGFKPEQNVQFKTFAETCIRNRLISAVKSASSLKHNPLNDGISLEEVLSEDFQTEHSAPELHRRVPEEQVLARENKMEIISSYSRYLSKLEIKILTLYLDGLSYKEMAEDIGKSEKTIDNAVQRIRKKLARQPNFGDDS